LNFSILNKNVYTIYIEHTCIENILLRKKKTDLHDGEEEEEDSRDLLHA